MQYKCIFPQVENIWTILLATVYLVNSVRTWSYYPLAPFLQSVTNSWMEPDQVGDAGGKGGNLKKSRPSQDPHRLNSDKWVEWQDQLHIGIQEGDTSMKDIKHNGSDQLNRLGPVCVPNGYSFPPFSLFSIPLIPLFCICLCPSSHSLCKYVERMALWGTHIIV
jgi:hypothetical protein